MSINKSVTTIIKRKMHQLNITEKQVAEYIEQPEEVVRQWLEDRLIFTHKHVWMVCDLLDMEPHDLLLDTFYEEFKW